LPYNEFTIPQLGIFSNQNWQKKALIFEKFYVRGQNFGAGKILVLSSAIRKRLGMTHCLAFRTKCGIADEPYKIIVFSYNKVSVRTMVLQPPPPGCSTSCAAHARH